MMHRAAGAFDVTLTPVAPAAGEAAFPARMALAKRFHGDLDATSEGVMLAAMTDVKGSAGYVAIERVTGTLHGRAGSFVLQHSGTMARGEGATLVTVVPDSGTGALAGVSGRMAIVVEGRAHRYDFAYELPEA
ncbi:MAG: DUF3224 domain-containing protein [Gemmatimonadales bacterium]|jgi:hypothetical protein|nr:DUF3224 domain-containing protein [Gemmatimonadales bacterium]